MDQVRSACNDHYHPRREMAVVEKMLAVKPTTWGIQIFVLVDVSNGYITNFNVYRGKSSTHTAHGLHYDAVMDLIQPSFLRTGYHIYMDKFYTSPQLLLDLASLGFGACGEYRDNRKGCPTGTENALTRKSERGTVRWVREGPLVFVKWMDTRVVSVCSTIHAAFSDEVVERNVKQNGCWSVKNFPCPTPVIAYNEHTGGVDLSEQKTQYFTTQRRSYHWYRNLLRHFVDNGATNAYILHCDICETKGEKPLTHKDFLVELVSQLRGVDSTGVPNSRKTDHVAVAIVAETDTSQRATQGRRICQYCHQVDKKRNLTPWKCKSCDVALCVILNRNCFEKWHK